jgi:hypothetical protein
MSNTISGRSPPTTSRMNTITSALKVSLITVGVCIACFVFVFGIASISTTHFCPIDSFSEGYSGSDLFVLILLVSVLVFSASCALLLAKVGLGYQAGDSSDETKIISRYIGLRKNPIIVTALIGGSLILLDAPFFWFDMHCVYSSGIWQKDLPWKPFTRYGWADVKNLSIVCSYAPPTRQEAGHWSDALFLRMDDGVDIGLGGSEPSQRVGRGDLRLAEALRGHSTVIDASQAPPACVTPDLKVFAGR